jgi:hypothetical protein
MAGWFAVWVIIVGGSVSMSIFITISAFVVVISYGVSFFGVYFSVFGLSDCPSVCLLQ